MECQGGGIMIKKPKMKLGSDISNRRNMDTIQMIIDKKIKSTTFPILETAIVVAADNVNKLATVHLVGSVNIIPNLKNRSNINLSTNDEVILVLINGGLDNCFIAWKK